MGTPNIPPDVSSVPLADSPAAEAGIAAGDVILQVNRKPVGSVEQVKKEIASIPAGKPLLLLVRPADGNERFAALSPE